MKLAFREAAEILDMPVSEAETSTGRWVYAHGTFSMCQYLAKVLNEEGRSPGSRFYSGHDISLVPRDELPDGISYAYTLTMHRF